MKNIFVFYTGGTIGMKQGAEGLAPDTALAEAALQPFSGRLQAHWHVCQPLIDSAAISPLHWAQWLPVLQQALETYDGVLVLHGTDTLAYTANLLALALDNPGKPLIITGAQKPYDHPHSDAPANLHTAIEALLREDVHETLIAFHHQLYPAVGSSKFSTEQDAGFTNTHFGTWQPRAVPDLGELPKRFDPDSRVVSYLLTPGCNTEMVAHALQSFPQQAAIILSYGHGNAPADPSLLAAITQFCRTGRLVLNISQAPQGRADATYAQSSALRHVGALSGGKCNIETATALMLLAAANQWQRSDLELALQRLALV